MTASNLFEQCTDATLAAAAAVCGIVPVTPMFRTTLRECAPLHEGFTVGDVARCYLTVRLGEIEQANQHNAQARATAAARK